MVTIPKHISGPDGLVRAVFATGLNDLRDADPRIAADALEFFGGDDYIWYLELSGLNPDWFPEVKHGNGNRRSSGGDNR